MSGLIDQGRIKHWAVSNFDADRLTEVLDLCDVRGLPRPVMLQPRYSLLDREVILHSK